MANVNKKVGLDISVNSKDIVKAMKDLSAMRKIIDDIEKLRKKDSGDHKRSVVTANELKSLQQIFNLEDKRKDSYDKLVTIQKAMNVLNASRNTLTNSQIASLDKLQQKEQARRIALFGDKKESEKKEETEGFKTYKNSVDAFKAKFTPSGILNKYQSDNEKKYNEAKKIKDAVDPRIKQLQETKSKSKLTKTETAELAGLEEQSAGAESAMSGAAASNPYVAAAMIAAKVITAGAKAVNEIFKKTLGISLSIKDNFNEMLTIVGEKLDMYGGMATYDIGSSLTTNANARDLMLKYGMDSGQTYGFAQAASMFGIDKGDMDANLAYMNDPQREMFNEYAQRQIDYYEKIESSGGLEAIQRMQLDFAMFKQDMANEFLMWFADNKDTIMDIMKFTMVVLRGLMDALLSILNFFGKGRAGISDSALSSDYTSIRNTSNVVNVNMSNNIEGVNTGEEGLARAGDQIGNVIRTAMNTIRI